jgi:antitoxin VapB
MEVFMGAIAKIFKNGRSQAVRLPKQFRFMGKEVRITKIGEKMILEPLEITDWPDGFWDNFTIGMEYEKS